MSDLLQQIADELPNGLHDTILSRCRVDFEKGTLELDVSVWVGEPDHGDPQGHREGRLVLEGLVFCQFEPPSACSAFSEPSGLTIDLCNPDPDHPLAASTPPDVAVSRLFVNQWNTFIFLAARSAKLVWNA
jgi:hypothetical protein